MTPGRKTFISTRISFLLVPCRGILKAVQNVAEKGYLILTDGDVIDHLQDSGYVLWINRFVRMLGIGYDPWKSQEVINMLAASGAGNVIKGIRQTYGTFTAPVESFEHGAKTGHIFY